MLRPGSTRVDLSGSTPPPRRRRKRMRRASRLLPCCRVSPNSPIPRLRSSAESDEGEGEPGEHSEVQEATKGATSRPPPTAASRSPPPKRGQPRRRTPGLGGAPACITASASNPIASGQLASSLRGVVTRPPKAHNRTSASTRVIVVTQPASWVAPRHGIRYMTQEPTYDMKSDLLLPCCATSSVCTNPGVFPVCRAVVAFCPSLSKVTSTFSKPLSRCALAASV